MIGSKTGPSYPWHFLQWSCQVWKNGSTLSSQGEDEIAQPVIVLWLCANQGHSNLKPWLSQLPFLVWKPFKVSPETFQVVYTWRLCCAESTVKLSLSTRRLAGGKEEEIAEFCQFVISQSNQMWSIQLCLLFFSPDGVGSLDPGEGFLWEPSLGRIQTFSRALLNKNGMHPRHSCCLNTGRMNWEIKTKSFSHWISVLRHF